MSQLGGQAAALGHVGFLKLLIRAKVPLDHKPSKSSFSMMLRAAFAGQLEVIRLLGEAKAELCPLRGCIAEGHRSVVLELIRLRTDPNTSWGTRPQDNPVGQAIMFNRPDMLELLEEHGVDIRAEGHRAYAEKMKATDCLQVMQSSDSDVRQRVR